MGELDDKVTLVTGGSAGIGLAIARRFAAEGATVYLTGRHKAELDAAVEAVGERAVGVQSDVSKLDDLDRLFEEIKAHSGRLDVVVANAGVGELARLGEITEGRRPQLRPDLGRRARGPRHPGQRHQPRPDRDPRHPWPGNPAAGRTAPAGIC